MSYKHASLLERAEATADVAARQNRASERKLAIRSTAEVAKRLRSLPSARNRRVWIPTSPSSETTSHAETTADCIVTGWCLACMVE